jgi:[acyl-carrier-protein] S-malonyltransferase/trans-AT polyketide synthase/acyltransferase/oxidoreductase domain-containing protein
MPRPEEGTTIGFVFPGQGSQKPGMAKDLHDGFAAARDVFAEASSALELDLGALCFSEDPRLDLTEYTQPAILTAEIAMVRVLERDFGLRATRFGGHSLGEYTALCAAGTLSLSTAVRLVRRRGALMQAAVPAGLGAMVAVVSAGIAARDLAVALAPLGVDVANENAPDQVVLSGPAEAIQRASELVPTLTAGAPCRVVPLNVSAPFHSRGMQLIETEFRALLEASDLDASRAASVTSNYTGRFHVPERAAVLEALTRQISGTVRWIANMHALAEAAGALYEVGPSRILRGFFTGLGREVPSLTSVRTIERALG